MKKAFALLLILMMALVLVACNPEPPFEIPTRPPRTTTTTQSTPEVKTNFTLTVTDEDGTEQTIACASSAKTLSEALMAQGLMVGETSKEEGFKVIAVNGITADWVTENAKWEFYINGEPAQTSVDTTELVEGATYSFVKVVTYTVKGEGATSFYFNVKKEDGSITRFIINTDKTIVSEALMALGMLSGQTTAQGLQVTTVNGITANLEREQTRWEFWINGETAQTGVDATEIVAGATYEMVKACVYTEAGGGGAFSFYFTVKDRDGTCTRFHVRTNKTTVAEALLELGLITAEKTEFGLNIIAVNGITADWDTEKSRWEFYIDGEISYVGVENTEIVEGAHYEMVKRAG